MDQENNPKPKTVFAVFIQEGAHPVFDLAFPTANAALTYQQELEDQYKAKQQLAIVTVHRLSETFE